MQTPLCGVSTEGQLYVITGQNDVRVHNEVWIYTLSQRVWRQVIQPPNAREPAIRYGASGGFPPGGTGTEFVVTHGFSRSKDRKKDTWIFDTISETWRDITPSGPKPFARCLHGAAWTLSGQHALWGGCGSGGFGPCPAYDTWHKEAGRGRWIKDTVCPPASIFPAGSALPGTDDQVIQYGGSGEKKNDAAAVLSASTGKWRRVRPAPDPVHGYPAIRQAMSMVANVTQVNEANGVVFMYGGQSRAVNPSTGSSMRGDLWALVGRGEEAATHPDGCAWPLLPILHASFMYAALWAFSIGATFTVRFFKHKAWFLKAHIGLQVTSYVLVTCGFAIAVLMVGSHFDSLHKIMGLISFILLTVQMLLGTAHVQKWLKPGTVRPMHATVGRILFISGVVTVVMGLLLLDPSSGIIGLGIAWVALCVLSFAVIDIYMRQAKKGVPMRYNDDKVRRFTMENGVVIVPSRVCADSRIQAMANPSLPHLSLAQVSNFIQEGRQIFWLDNIVFDIEKWIPLHPGGQAVLKTFLHRDASPGYYGQTEHSSPSHGDHAYERMHDFAIGRLVVSQQDQQGPGIDIDSE
eukprot:TRINITY_DN1708_c1_g1_i1.p1 TRINITY_DN1708_c1_g1~~TRINITY_DN1708_c1_g1_i1.p1  ORF type:complete len:576 (-),score=50.31 TRINITY_DN1708_c1_g1_i1:98-1825(-)